MEEKITHEQARIDVAILNKTNAKLRLENDHEQRLHDYITQQIQLEKALKLYKELSEMVTILSPEKLKRYSEIMDELKELKS